MATYESDPNGPCKQASDRIEELEKELDTWKKCYAGARETYIEKEHRIMELEERVKALELAINQTIMFQKSVARRALEVREIGRRALESK